MEIGTGRCSGCGETTTVYGGLRGNGRCYECQMEATGGNFAEELLAYEQGEGSER